MYDPDKSARLAAEAAEMMDDLEPGELLPCPFCGGMAERVDIPEASSENDLAGDPNAGGSFIRCVSCDACTMLEFGRKESLEGRWNGRFRNNVPALAAALQDANAEVVRLREALRFYANPEVYKPHPHGLAFDDRDLSFCAKAVLPKENPDV